MPEAALLTFPRLASASEPLKTTLRRCGAVALSLEQLLELSVGPGLASLAASLGDRWHHLWHLDYLELSSMKIDDREAVAFLACIELARRFARTKVLPESFADRPAQVAHYLFLRHFRSDQEVVGAVFLDARTRIITDEILYRGTLTRTSVEPRAILRRGLALHARSFVLFHTHPSGDPSPSDDDLYFTHRLADAASTVGIELDDHLILGTQGNWVSLKRRRWDVEPDRATTENPSEAPSNWSGP